MLLNETMNKFHMKITGMSPVPFTLAVLGFYLTLLTLWGAATIAFITWGIPFLDKFYHIKEGAYDSLGVAFLLTWFCILFIAIYNLISDTLIGEPFKALMNTNNWFLFYFIRNPLLFITWPFTSIIIPCTFILTIIFWPLGIALAGFPLIGLFLGIVIFMAARRR